MQNSKKIWNHIFLLLFSLCGAYGIESVYSIGPSSINQANKFINVLIFFIILYIYKKSTFKDARKKITTFILSTTISTILLLGGQLEYTGEIIWTILTVFKIVSLSFAFFPLLYKLFEFLDKYKIPESKTKHIFLKAFLAIFVFNFLVFLAAYPGVYGYDAGFQILQFFNDEVQLTSHFSVFYSAFLSGAIYLGKTIFNSYQIGFAFYALLQMAFLSFVSSQVCIFCMKRLKNKYLYYLSVLFFCVYPLYTVMTISSCQDAIFGGIFALVVLNLIKMVEDENYYNKKVNLILLIIELFFLCIAKNNGVYCVYFILISIILLKKNKKIITISAIILSIILFKIFTGPFYNFINVYKETSFREISSIPSQQMARVYVNNEKIYNKLERDSLNKFYNIEGFQYYNYRQSISDLTKGALNVDYTAKNIPKYMLLWVKIGIKDPKNYIEAFLLNNIGIWYPNKNYPDDRMYHPYIEYEMLDAKKWNDDYIDIKRESKFKIYDNILETLLIKNKWQDFPIISTLFTTGTYFITFIFLLALTIYKKNYNLLIPLSAVIGMYLTLLLSPVALLRYCFPILIILPILLSLIIKNNLK